MSQPILYSIVDKDQINEMIKSFQECLDLPIQVIDEQGSILLSSGEITRFCSKFKAYLPSGDSCEIVHSNASKKAIDLGESYIFSCHANLNHIVFPLLHNGIFIGSILVGPFLMDEPDSLLIQDIAKRYKIPTSALLDLYDEIVYIKVLIPKIVTQVSRLLYYLFSNLISESKQQFIINQEKLHQQAKISESIQMYKYNNTDSLSTYPFDLEKKLMTKVKTGNFFEAKGVLNDLLGYVFFSEGNSLDIIKSRSIELCSLLSRAAIEGGAPTDNILKINNNFLKIISNINDFENLCYKLQEVVEAFTESMFGTVSTKNNGIIKKAIHYIAKNFSRNITLEDVAKEVHLNPSYFSSFFKQSTGSSFKEYLNMIRIEESKRLLANTDYSVIDIAVATGFDTQSYFSKVFKKYTGLTPRQYR
jgi:two-component system, response regulator YesN